VKTNRRMRGGSAGGGEKGSGDTAKTPNTGDHRRHTAGGTHKGELGGGSCIGKQKASEKDAPKSRGN